MANFIRLASYQPKEGLWIKEVAGINPTVEYNSYDATWIDDIGNPHLTFKNKHADLTDYVGGVATSFPIISHRLKEVLETLVDSNNIQFFECASNYAKKAKFYIMHIVGYIDCFDWENSGYTKRKSATNENEYWADEIKKVVFLKDKVGDRNIFRMSQSETNIFISEKLEDIILEKRLRVTLVRTKNLTQVTDSDPNNPKQAMWGHENI